MLLFQQFSKKILKYFKRQSNKCFEKMQKKIALFIERQYIYGIFKNKNSKKNNFRQILVSRYLQ